MPIMILFVMHRIATISNPNGSFDMDGDGFCEDVDCNDSNPTVYPGAQLDPETSGGEDRNCNGQMIMMS